VAHHDRLVVIDLLARAEVGSIPGQDLSKAIIVPDLNRGFVTDGDAGNVIVFDLKTLESKGTVKTDPDADAICYEPVTRRIFTFNGDKLKPISPQDPHPHPEPIPGTFHILVLSENLNRG
jgi:hypothetical protein